MRCMGDAVQEPESIARRLAEQAARNELRATVHGQREMVEEDIT